MTRSKRRVRDAEPIVSDQVGPKLASSTKQTITMKLEGREPQPYFYRKARTKDSGAQRDTFPWIVQQVGRDERVVPNTKGKQIRGVDSSDSDWCLGTMEN